MTGSVLLRPSSGRCFSRLNCVATMQGVAYPIIYLLIPPGGLFELGTGWRPAADVNLTED